MRRRRSALLWLAVLLAGVLAVAVLPRLAAPAAPTAPTATIARGDLVVTVPATGTLEAIDPVQLGPPQIPNKWDFKITYLAAEGKVVRVGEPVIRFDGAELERELAARRNEAETARQEIARREADLELEGHRKALQRAEAEARQRKAALAVDVPAELLAARELEKSRLEAALAEREVAFRREQLTTLARRRAAELAAARQKRDRAELSVAELETGVAALTVQAPHGGTAVYLANWRGEKKKVGDPAWRGEKILALPDLERLRARAEVDEADAGRLRLGQRLTYFLDAHPDHELHGTVTAIASSVQRPTPSSRLKVVRAEVTLERIDGERMRPGMRFRGDIEVERVSSTLLLPQAAVLDTPAGPRVFRRRLWGFDEVVPRLGRRGGDVVEVLGGLAAGDRVALSDPRRRHS